MPLDLDDGYTLNGETATTDRDGKPIPSISFRYRPALPRAIYQLRFDTRMARSGDEEQEAGAKFVSQYLVDWDVTDNGRTTKPTQENALRLHPFFLEQIVDIISRWAAKPLPSGVTAKDEAEKNSHGA
jgi:hypothetical protein